MKRIQRLLTGLAASLLFCACGAGDEEAPSAGDPAASADRASEQAEQVQSSGDLDSDGQTAVVVVPPCTTACTKVSSTNLTGTCCICNGVQRTFHKSAFNANVYLCM